MLGVSDWVSEFWVQVIVPDKWKDGASNTTEGGGRKINENKLLSKKSRLHPLSLSLSLSLSLEDEFPWSRCIALLRTSCGC